MSSNFSIYVTNIGRSGLAHVGGAALAHRLSFVSGHAVFLLPSLDLLSWFNDTSIDSL
jgi:hypothetical protein